MNFFKKFSPEWALRLGFAAMYLYSGVDIFLHPSAWTWAVPSWFIGIAAPLMPIEAYLKLQAIGEIVFALAFLTWFIKPRLLKYIALLAAAEMAGILLLGKTGVDSITFRDLGLLGGLIALSLLLHKQSKGSLPSITQ